MSAAEPTGRRCGALLLLAAALLLLLLAGRRWRLVAPLWRPGPPAPPGF